MDWDIHDERLFKRRAKVKKLVALKKKGKIFAQKIDVPFEKLTSYKDTIRDDLKHAEEDVEVYTNYIEFQYRIQQEERYPEKYKDLPPSKFVNLQKGDELSKTLQVLANQSVDEFFEQNKYSINERLFVEHYVACREATEAAKRAGYSPKSAKVSAHNLMKKPRIHRAIAHVLSKPLDKFNITPEKVIQDLVTLRDRAMEVQPVKDSQGNYLGEFQCNLREATNIVKLLGEYLGMFQRTMRHVGHDGGPVRVQVETNLDALSDEELRYYEERILPKVKVIEQ